MDSLFKVVNGEEIICLKSNHNEQVMMIIMDKEVPLQDRLLCSKCFRAKRQITKNIISIEEAQNLIMEKHQKLNHQISVRKQSTSKDLDEFKTNMMNLRSKTLQHFDEIIRISQLWITQIMNFQTKNDVNSFFKDLEEQQQDQNYEHEFNKGNETHFKKIDLIFQKLLNIEEYSKCHQLLKNIINGDQKQPEFPKQQIKQIQSEFLDQQIKQKQQQFVSSNPIKTKISDVELINIVEQNEWSGAIRFNYKGSIMVAGCEEDIKLWMFDQGNMIEKKRLKGHTGNVVCFVFSKKYNWFASGGYDKKIMCWKEQANQDWISTQPVEQHQRDVMGLLLNNKEDQLISCSVDSTIKVWKVNCQQNQIEYNYTLEKKHSLPIDMISLNESETYLISCGRDKKIILWNQGQNMKWQFKYELSTDDWGYRLSFINDNQIIWQQKNKGVNHLFEIINGQLIKKPELIIQLDREQQDEQLFPIIINKQRQVIVYKYSKFVYFLKQQADGKFKQVSEPIDCGDRFNYGAFTENGEYLAIWSDKLKQFRIYAVKYE